MYNNILINSNPNSICQPFAFEVPLYSQSEAKYIYFLFIYIFSVFDCLAH